MKSVQELVKKYPEIFDTRFYIECGDGWYNLLDFLCKEIQKYLDKEPNPDFKATQVKEKFGTLRFYTTMCDNYMEKLIEKAEHLSSITCENCGDRGKLSKKGYWLSTLCNKCRKERKQ
jgi:hypothetical protein